MRYDLREARKWIAKNLGFYVGSDVDVQAVVAVIRNTDAYAETPEQFPF